MTSNSSLRASARSLALPRALLVLPLALAACGDNLSHGAAAGAPDAGPTPLGVSTALVAAGDFNVTGLVTTVRVPQGVVTPDAVAGVAGGDPFVRRYGDEIFIINRSSGDNVTILDRTTLQLVQQVATGAKSNPQDVAPVGRKLYVPGLGTAGVVVIDRDHPDAPTTIDLGALDAVDHQPDCVSAYAVGDRLYVACGLLDNFAAKGPGVIAVIDTTSDKLVTSFALPAKNPVGYLIATPATSVFGGDLLIATAPDFQDYSTGCLARVKTGAAPVANGCAVTNAALGGLANHYEVSADGSALWIDDTSYDASFTLSGKVVALDLATGHLGAAAMTPPTMVATDLAACPNGYAVVVDGTTGKAGVRIFAADGTEQTTGALDIGRAPDYGNNTICY